MFVDLGVLVLDLHCASLLTEARFWCGAVEQFSNKTAVRGERLQEILAHGQDKG